MNFSDARGVLRSSVEYKGEPCTEHQRYHHLTDYTYYDPKAQTTTEYMRCLKCSKQWEITKHTGEQMNERKPSCFGEPLGFAIFRCSKTCTECHHHRECYIMAKSNTTRENPNAFARRLH